MSSVHIPGRRETAASFTLLAILALIAAGIWIVHRQAVLAAEPERSPGPGEPAGSGLPSVLPDGLVVLSPPEAFDSSSLSGKIDGKADYYLTSGFVALHCQRFAQKDSPDAWFEVYLYKMGEPKNAFAVFSGQRRESAETLDFPGQAYRSGNALFFLRGSYYVELIACSEEPSLRAALLRYATGLRSVLEGDEPESPTEEDFFPGAGAVKGSLTLSASDAFGFDGFDGLWTLSIHQDNQPLLAFAKPCASVEEAVALAETYGRHLLSIGAKRLPPPEDLPDLEMYDVFGQRELVVRTGARLSGIHEADEEAAALALIRRMLDSIQHTEDPAHGPR